jgi:hypothetical protein
MLFRLPLFILADQLAHVLAGAANLIHLDFATHIKLTNIRRHKI